MKLKLFLILFSFIINSLFAMDNYTHTQNIPENIYHRGEDGFNINASYIFWQPKEAGTELALMFTDTLYSDIACDSVIYFDESYKSGFKVGAGYFMPYDDWELNVVLHDSLFEILFPKGMTVSDKRINQNIIIE